MKRSSGYPDRIRTIAQGGVESRQSGVSPRKRTFEVLVALCAVAALVLGIVNRCNQQDLERKLERLTGKNGLNDLAHQKNEEDGKKKFLGKIKRVKPAEADSGAHALPPQDPGPVDLGSHIKIVIPPKTK